MNIYKKVQFWIKVNLSRKVWFCIEPRICNEVAFFVYGIEKLLYAVKDIFFYMQNQRVSKNVREEFMKCFNGKSTWYEMIAILNLKS